MSTLHWWAKCSLALESRGEVSHKMLVSVDIRGENPLPFSVFLSALSRKRTRWEFPHPTLGNCTMPEQAWGFLQLPRVRAVS